MKDLSTVFRSGERAEFVLRSLYSKYGYSQFKMSKFEEYDLYVRNKDFLVSENVITFTDTDGRLMALKPDVTLSIIKNSRNEGGVKKVYYDENVYRVSKGTKSFKEIMQVGLECLGDVDDYCIYEVLMLASKSLTTISENSVLDISHLGIVSGIMEKINLSTESTNILLDCIENKNSHGIDLVCEKENVCEEDKKVLTALVSTYGVIEDVLPKLEIFENEYTKDAVNQLKSVCLELIRAGIKNVRIDFSVINDMKYYNGIVFKGFVSGIPTGILSGGQYDKLMRKMKRNESAIGFAVYLDLLERLDENDNKLDVDVLVVYEKGVSLKTIEETVNSFIKQGLSVSAQAVVPEKLRYGKMVTLKKEN